MSTETVTIAEKLSALRQISQHLGLLGRRRSVTPEDLMERDDAVELVAWAMIGLTEPGREWWQRAACGTILDMFMPGWRENATPEILGPILGRESAEVRHWRAAVLARDGHACQRCGSIDKLHAHHILRWADVPEARIVVGNGVTLCEACHIAEHHGLRDVGQADTGSGGEARC
jgi:hypothetical protein